MGDRSLYDEFIALYNEMDREFRRDGGLDRDVPFVHAASRYAERHPHFERWLSRLRAFAQLRNVAAHDLDPRAPWFLPSPEAVAELRRMRDEVLVPLTAGEAFGRDVVTLDPSEPLEVALAYVRSRAFAQFPIYAGKQFEGLLTQGGIVRWLADQDGGRWGELRTCPVREVLAYEEERTRTVFVARHEAAEHVAYLFRETRGLVAVIVTPHGRPTERPVGLAVGADVARMSD